MSRDQHVPSFSQGPPHPLKPMKSPIVPTVKSMMMYMPRLCISSIIFRQSSTVP
jgi:hypothetical protein